MLIFIYIYVVLLLLLQFVEYIDCSCDDDGGGSGVNAVQTLSITIASRTIVLNPDNNNCMLEQHIVTDNINAHIKITYTYEHKN